MINFLGYGRREMSRYELIQQYIDKTGCGVEIGPSHNPIAPKSSGYRVEIIDHLDKEGLREKYTGHNVNLDNIEDVDYVWHGEKYSQLVGSTNHYDWIIASHVIEHMPDIISFINDCDEILTDNGIIILAIPDACHCFDYMRQISSISRVIDAYLNGHTRHTVGTGVDHVLNVCTMDGSIAWNSASDGEFKFMHSVEDARNLLDQDNDPSVYQDFHAWCFTPHSFRMLMEDLYHLGLIAVREVRFLPTGGFEFFMILGRKGDGPKLGRLELIRKVRQELSQEASLLKRLDSKLRRLVKRFVRKTLRFPHS